MSETKAGRYHCLVALLALSLLLLTACGLFDTRDVTPPDLQPQCPLVDAIRPVLAIDNMEQSFACGAAGGGLDTYESSIADDFDFNAAVVEEQAVQDFFTDWEQASVPKDEAVAAFSTQMGAAQQYNATLVIEADDEDEISYDDGFLFDDIAYSLVFVAAGDTAARFAGQADIYVRDPGSGFVVYRWDDSEAAGGFATLGRFWYDGTSAGATGK